MSAFIVTTENNAFKDLFPEISCPLGSSLLVTNDRAFLTVGILGSDVNSLAMQQGRGSRTLVHFVSVRAIY